ncbi:GNAT family N-acetyltransferase [Mycobacterium antarcticum]|uniref:GNAT family N-acetyltransferase n=1 Tax=Mycolicibacterium sp. TUM20984 TaxID=3023368 RepID=UPI002395B68C|nr:GNAT family N-acetyltransferase [Mycolicibacterium sp. TUM20984]GLP78625.1 hypothetical protein TUM20984_00450 [Mycolicibacterium sp. TUM20984]
MNRITFRSATADDFEFFFRLHRESLGPYVDQVWGWEDEVQRAYLRRTIDIASTQVIVVDDVDVGRLTLGHRDDDIYLGLIEITPSHQGRGIGGRIVRSVLDAAFADAKGVRLHVLAVNAGAHRLYRRLGFADVSREGIAPEIRIEMRAHPVTTPGPSAEVRFATHPWGLRSGTADDRGFIIEMARHASVIEDWPLPDAESEGVDSLMPSSDDVVIVATNVLGRPVGAAWTLHSDPPLMLDAAGASVPELCIAVAPGARGRGVGGVLLEELARVCASHHVALCLNVHQRNGAARKLYVRNGFEDAGQGRGTLGIAMSKKLCRSVVADVGQT